MFSFFQDLNKFKGMEKLASTRKATYESIVDQLEKLKVLWAAHRRKLLLLSLSCR